MPPTRSDVLVFLLKCFGGDWTQSSQRHRLRLSSQNEQFGDILEKSRKFGKMEILRKVSMKGKRMFVLGKYEIVMLKLV